MMLLNKIQKKVNRLRSNEITFGKIFTDHMLICNFKNNNWDKPKISSYKNISLPPSAMCFHYGQTIFEGLKAYRNIRGKINLFRPYKNLERFNKSALRLCMPPIDENIFINGIKKLVKLDESLIPKGENISLYIRPFMISTDNILIAKPSQKYKFIIITSLAGNYYNKKLSVNICTDYSRACQGGVGFVKCGGNYATSFFPTIKNMKKGFDQIVWTDSKTHKYIEELGTMNIFIRINDTLVTPPISDTILNGITRDSIITLCKELDINIEVRKISIDELYKKLKSNKILEVFGCGTAAIINSFNIIGINNEKFKLYEPKLSYANIIKEKIQNIQYGIEEDKYKWIYEI